MDKKNIYEFIVGNRNTSMKELEKKIEAHYFGDEKLQQILNYYLLGRKFEWEELKESISHDEKNDYFSFYKELFFLENYKLTFTKNKKALKEKKYFTNQVPNDINELIELGNKILTNNDAFFVELYLANLFAMIGDARKAEELLKELEEKNLESKIIKNLIYSQRERIRFNYYPREMFLQIVEKEIHGQNKIFYKFLFETIRYIRIEFVINILIFFINSDNLISYCWFAFLSIINIIGYIIGSKTSNLYMVKAYLRKEIILIASFVSVLIIYTLILN